MKAIDRNIEQQATRLFGKGIPQERAVIKAEGTVVGKLAAITGTLVMGLTAALALTVVLKGGALTWAVGAVVGIVGFLGFILFAVGMTLVSREASPAIGAMGELLVKLVRALRGAKNSK